MNEAFRWEAGVMSSMGDLPGGDFYSEATAVSSGGSVLVGQSESAFGREAFRTLDGIIDHEDEGLGDLLGGDFRSYATDVSSDGSVVVGWSDTNFNLGGEMEAFIWDETNGMRNLRTVLVSDFGLDLTGWTLREARSISADGLIIVGWSDSPNGHEAWVADLSEPIPEPSTIVLFGIGGLGILAYVWRRRKQSA